MPAAAMTSTKRLPALVDCRKGFVVEMAPECDHRLGVVNSISR